MKGLTCMATKENWRRIPGFTGYSVSNLGGVMNNRTGLILTPKDFYNSSGRYSLYNRNRKVTMSLDQIFRLTFKRDIPIEWRTTGF